MPEYTFKPYHDSYINDQARIGIEVARQFVWPFAFRVDELRKLHAMPDFDPESRLYCFSGDRMVGYTLWTSRPANDDSIARARIDFPRLLPGHERAAQFLLEKLQDAMKRKNIYIAEMPVTTMMPGSFELAERLGFTPGEKYPRGFKVYYAYDLRRGKLDISTYWVNDLDLERDLDETAELASIWYKKPVEWCKNYIEDIEMNEILIAHLNIRRRDEMVAACVAAPNDHREKLAGIFYIHVKDEEYLLPLIAKVIANCADRGYETLIVDLINEHRVHEATYKSLGFTKAAEWAIYEKTLR
jgi:hypothetical protein